MSKIVFHIKKTVYDEVVLPKDTALAMLKSIGCSNEKLLFTILSGRIQSVKVEADESEGIPEDEKMVAVEEFLEDLVERTQSFQTVNRPETKSDIFPDGIPDAVLQKLKERRDAKK
jgi:hypothetical protein